MGQFRYENLVWYFALMHFSLFLPIHAPLSMRRERLKTDQCRQKPRTTFSAFSIQTICPPVRLRTVWHCSRRLFPSAQQAQEAICQTQRTILTSHTPPRLV